MLLRHARRSALAATPVSFPRRWLCFWALPSSSADPSDTDSELRSLKRFALAHHEGVMLSPPSFSSVLSECANTDFFCFGRSIHALCCKLGLHSNLFVASSLINFYCKCHPMWDAQKVYDEMPERGVVACNSLISGYSTTQDACLVFDVLVEMNEIGISPNAYTFSGLLVSCSRLGALDTGIQIHCLVLKLGFYSNVVVGTALMDMYATCSSLSDSRKVFEEISEKNVVTWTAMVNGYARHDEQTEAMFLLRNMVRLGLGLHSMTCSSILSSFFSDKDLDHGKQIHCQVIRRGLDLNVYVLLTLMTMYSKVGSREDFFKIFAAIPDLDPVCCNSIIASFSHLGYDLEVLKQFSRMVRNCVHMDFFTFISVLKAIGILSALEEGKQTHALVYKTGYASNVHVQNGLVSMYARCGAIVDSRCIFSSMSSPDLVSWNSILSGCAQHGFGAEAVELFGKMTMSGLKPDNATYLSVLTACSHAGLLQKGLECFDFIKNSDNQISLTMKHYACIIDLLGRAGRLEEAENFVNSLPFKPGASAYRALLSACNIHGELDIASRAAKALQELCPSDPSAYVLLSRVFAQEGCWDDAAGVRKLMSERQVKKRWPGISWIGVNGKNHVQSLITNLRKGSTMIT